MIAPETARQLHHGEFTRLSSAEVPGVREWDRRASLHKHVDRAYRSTVAVGPCECAIGICIESVVSAALAIDRSLQQALTGCGSNV